MVTIQNTDDEVRFGSIHNQVLLCLYCTLEWCDFCADQPLRRYKHSEIHTCSVHQFVAIVSYINQRTMNNLLYSINLYNQVEISFVWKIFY